MARLPLSTLKIVQGPLLPEQLFHKKKKKELLNFQSI